MSSHNERSKGVSRRQFMGTAAAAAGITIVPRHVLGAGFQAPSDTVNVAVVGYAHGMGSNNLKNAMRSDNIIALCDVAIAVGDLGLRVSQHRLARGEHRLARLDARCSLLAVPLDLGESALERPLALGKRRLLLRELRRGLGALPVCIRQLAKLVRNLLLALRRARLGGGEL